MDWTAARPTVRYRLYWVMTFWPCSPSFCSSSSLGMTTVRSCMMIDAVMYGMMPRANTATRLSAPPENRLRKPTTPPPRSGRSS